MVRRRPRSAVVSGLDPVDNGSSLGTIPDGLEEGDLPGFATEPERSLVLSWRREGV